MQRLLTCLVFLLAAGPLFAAGPLPPDVVVNHTFYINGSGNVSHLVLRCDDPSTRADGTPFDPLTELYQYRWFADVHHSATGGGTAWTLTKVPLGQTSTCEYAAYLLGGNDYDVYAETEDTGHLRSADSRKVQLRFQAGP